MSFLNSFDISVSGLTAQRQRLDTVAENIANAQTTRTADGGPYRRKIVSFEEKPASSFQEEFNSRLRRSGMKKGGVRVSQITEDQRDLIPVYDPDHPDANEGGLCYDAECRSCKRDRRRNGCDKIVRGEYYSV